MQVLSSLVLSLTWIRITFNYNYCAAVQIFKIPILKGWNNRMKVRISPLITRISFQLRNIAE
jgi:hypothetical protein